MLKVTCDLIGTAPISFSRMVQSAKTKGETSESYEERTWKERMHVDVDGKVYMPPMALKNALWQIAKYRSDSVPGKGKATYTKYFDAGIMVMDNLCFGIDAKDVQGETFAVPSDGKRGGEKRVKKTFPFLPAGWRTTATIYVLEPTLMDKTGVEKIKEYLEHAGKFVGIGRFRPSRGGFYGRFMIENFKTKEE